MPEKTPLKDIVVILPGITGSVLQKDGVDLWNVSGQAIWQIIRSLGSRIQDLKLEGDDPNGGDIGDGIKATSLIADTHLIPGLVKIDGYTKTSKLITDNFQVIEGNIYEDPEDKAANFYHFPYDWRRDNSANANILKRLLDKRLHQWRQSPKGAKDAKVILLAHSMGGLVSRYYLEVLGGWQDCRALFTFGTPYRGSVNAVNFLANGYKKAFIDLTEVMRSLTSVYQLMPIYEMLNIDGQFYRIAESPIELPHIVKKRAEEALKFHRKIEEAVKTNQEDIDYLKNPYQTVPII
ncbi:MAG: lecithin--cholesterol acyltransferase, partial [Xenococcus sp. (in: cyanobacteria)]